MPSPSQKWYRAGQTCCDSLWCSSAGQDACPKGQRQALVHVRPAVDRRFAVRPPSTGSKRCPHPPSGRPSEKSRLMGQGRLRKMSLSTVAIDSSSTRRAPREVALPACAEV